MSPEFSFRPLLAAALPFRPVTEVLTPDGPALLMRIQRADFG
ncbi:MAG TPA: hypothetical protein VJV79_36185 [Polyangiaceae bacterium]|nr:hypothetical protein [Polyangiaceae bacterium]